MKKLAKETGGVFVEVGIIIAIGLGSIVAFSSDVRVGVNRVICSMLGGINGVQFTGTGQLSKFTVNQGGMNYHICQTVAKTSLGTTYWGTVINVNRFLW